jgi:hypothetical protein
VSVALVRAHLAEAGFGIVAPISVEAYDRLVPDEWRADGILLDAQSVLVVANAGRALWHCFQRAPESALETDPLDTYTRRCLRDATEPDAAFALYNDKRDDRYLPLVALAREAGLGAPGRIGVLLHPRYGPWISFRGVVFVRERILGEHAKPFDPCTGCPAPCAAACHGNVVGTQGLDAQGCYEARLTLEPCALRCDARRACVIGPEYAFSPEQEAHHTRIRSSPS